ncbi:MAG: glycosyltransferase family 4 protein [Polyangiaceae bacterium]
MTRIAVVSTSYPAHADDAAGHFVAAEVSELVRAGHHVTVFAPSALPGTPTDVSTLTARGESVPPTGPQSDENPRVVRLRDGGACGFPGLSARLRARPTRALGLARFLFSLRRELARRGPFEQVIVHWLLPSTLPLLAVTLGPATLEVVVHGSDARLLAALPRPLARSFLKQLLKRPLTLRCVSHELAELLRQVGGAELAPRLAGCTRVGPPALDVSQAPARSLARARAEQALGVDGNTSLALIVARLVPDKRVDVALSAAALVPKLRVVVVGDGPLREELAARFPNAHFLGHLPRSEALGWIAAADVLLSASRKEGAPTVVREARALGVPVAACQSGDLTLWARDDPGLFVVA